MLKLWSRKSTDLQHFLIGAKHRAYLFLIFVFCPYQIKNYIITELVSNFFIAPCKRVTSSLQKRKHHNSLTNVLEVEGSCSRLFQNSIATTLSFVHLDTCLFLSSSCLLLLVHLERVRCIYVVCIVNTLPLVAFAFVI